MSIYSVEGDLMKSIPNTEICPTATSRGKTTSDCSYYRVTSDGHKNVYATLTGGSSFSAAAWSKCLPGQRPSSAPAPPQGAPGGSGQLSTPRVRPSHWVPSHHRGCSRQPPPKPTISPLLTIQALPIALASAVTTPLWAAVYVGAEASEALTRVWNAALDQQQQQQHGT